MQNKPSILRKTQEELFPEEDNARVCFHPNQTNTINTNRCSSLDYWCIGLYWD